MYMNSERQGFGWETAKQALLIGTDFQARETYRPAKQVPDQLATRQKPTVIGVEFYSLSECLGHLLHLLPQRCPHHTGQSPLFPRASVLAPNIFTAFY
jgi:hypothetical protein